MRTLNSVFICSAAALVVAAPALAQDATFAKRIPAEASGEVQITNVAGSITVKVWDRTEIDVQAQLHGGIETVEVSQQSGRNVIEVVYPRTSGHSRSADLVVSIPAGSRLEVSAVSADVVVSGVRGAMHLQAVSGNIRSNVPGGEFEAKSVSGDITLLGNGQSADMHVSTVSGAASLKSGAGSLDARSTSGDLVVDLAPANTVRARSTSGNVKLTGRLASGANIEAETVSGDVSIQANAENGFKYDIKTLSGDIRNCLGAEAVRASKYGPGRQLNGTRGVGQASVRLKTLSGEIELCDR